MNLRADEIILKEGKTLAGRITKEDDQEYTLLMGSNMVLRVAKSKVRKVVRTIVPKPARPTVRSSASSAIAVSTASTPEVRAVPEVERTTIKSGVVSIDKAVKTKATGAKTVWAVTWEGESEKEAEQSKWKWAVVRATITPSSHTAPVIAGQLVIFDDALQSFAEEVTALRAKDEPGLRAATAERFETMKSQAAKRQSGYERRNKKIFDSEKK